MSLSLSIRQSGTNGSIFILKATGDERHSIEVRPSFINWNYYSEKGRERKNNEFEAGKMEKFQKSTPRDLISMSSSNRFCNNF